MGLIGREAFHDRVKMASATTAATLVPELGAGSPRRKSGAEASAQAAGRPRRGLAAEASALAAGAMLEGVDLAANSVMPDVFKQFGKFTSSKGVFGYIRIETFDVTRWGVDAFIREFIRIADLLPQEGLIIDVRGNGGGVIAAGEGLLQTLTPVTIEPERFHLITTPLVLQMCEQDQELARWTDSMKEAVEIGSTFSQGFPLTPAEFCNSIGQTYQGPVVLIVDAGCYSTTDIFAAGFQDHNIGVVLGTSGHTGADGANVWKHTDLQQTLPRPHPPHSNRFLAGRRFGLPSDAAHGSARVLASRWKISASPPMQFTS